MARYLTIARPYALALFDEAKENDAFDAWFAVLKLLSQISQDKSVSSLLNHPELTVEQWVGLYEEICVKTLPNTTSQLKAPLNNFLKLLALRDRLIILPDIFFIYHQLLTENRHAMNVQVISAMPLSELQQISLKKSLEKKYNRHIELTIQLDASLLGGYILRTDKWVMDGSIKKTLNRLEQHLIS